MQTETLQIIQKTPKNTKKTPNKHQKTPNFSVFSSAGQGLLECLLGSHWCLCRCLATTHWAQCSLAGTHHQASPQAWWRGRGVPAAVGSSVRPHPGRLEHRPPAHLARWQRSELQLPKVVNPWVVDEVPRRVARGYLSLVESHIPAFSPDARVEVRILQGACSSYPGP